MHERQSTSAGVRMVKHEVRGVYHPPKGCQQSVSHLMALSATGAAASMSLHDDSL